MLLEVIIFFNKLDGSGKKTLIIYPDVLLVSRDKTHSIFLLLIIVMLINLSPVVSDSHSQCGKINVFALQSYRNKRQYKQIVHNK